MSTNYRKVFAIKKDYEKKVHNYLGGNVENKSGIYVFKRKDENGIYYAYVGQAKKLISRIAEHLIRYEQHIDKSLKVHGLYDENKKPYGWEINYYYCDEEELDKCEKETITRYFLMGWQMYNKTTGSQGNDKSGIGENKLGKGYYDGIKQGYKNCLKEIKVLFEKYLDPTIKGKSNKIKERKLAEFKEMLNEREDNAL